MNGPRDAPGWDPSDIPLKVFIRDIHSMDRVAIDSNYYLFRGKRVRKVDIMGVVTEVRGLRDEVNLYRVDDGTGEILCRYNHLNPVHVQEREEIDELQDMVAGLNYLQPSETGRAMELILEDSFKRCHEMMSTLQQGDCAHLQGFISTFHETREINAYTLYKVPEYLHELDRISELSALYTDIYSKFNN